MMIHQSAGMPPVAGGIAPGACLGDHSAVREGLWVSAVRDGLPSKLRPHAVDARPCLERVSRAQRSTLATHSAEEGGLVQSILQRVVSQARVVGISPGQRALGGIAPSAAGHSHEE